MINKLNASQGVLAPGVFDPLTALLARNAGFDTVYLSGASLAYTQLGCPDLGFLSLSQVVDTVSRIKNRTDVDIIVDADTGFGNALNVMHTVKSLELAGANVVQLEDQQMPKRCGHLAGKALVSTAEMCGKIRAALDTRQHQSTAIMARTDGIAVEGFESALDRAEAYLEAGADILFVEAPESIDQMKTLCARFIKRVPLLANMVEGGNTPIRTATELHDIGFRVVIAPGSLARIMARAAVDLLKVLKTDGSTLSVRDRMYTFKELNGQVGLPEFLDAGRLYEAPEKE